MGMMQTFDFESTAVRVVMREEDPWFVAVDVCRVLEIVNSRDALEKLDEDEKGVALTDTLGGRQQTAIISESGLYTLILRCRDAVTPGTLPHRFRKCVTSVILPSIRRTGSFGVAPLEGEDARIWGQPLPKLNTLFAGLRAMGNYYGPEYARACFEAHLAGKRSFPNPRKMTVGAITGSSKDDPMGCLKHLLRAATGKNVAFRERFSLALYDKAAAKSLADFGVMFGVGTQANAVYIAGEHPFLEKLYSDTQWAGDWRAALRLLPGAQVLKGKVRFGANAYPAVVVPKSLIVDTLHPSY